VSLAGAALGNLHRLYELGEVLQRTNMNDGTTVISLRIPAERDAAFRRAFPEAKVASA
jgi:GTP-binding protein HflX